MLINTTKSVSNNVWAASVAVEFSSLETEYAKAYGEPLIDLYGAIPYVPAAPATPAGQITLDQESDLGSPAASGSADWNAGLDAWELQGSGTFPADKSDTDGFYKFAEEVVGDFQFVARLDSVIGGLATSGDDPTIVSGFRIGLAMYYGNASSDPSIIYGWGSHLSGFNMALWHRPVASDPYAEINAIARNNPNGVFLRLTRTSLTLLAEYSIDNGDTWNTLGSTTLQRQAYRVGLFINSGTDTLVKAVLSNVSLTQTPVEDVNTFTIAGEKKVLMRSQGPHTFKLDAKLDTEAQRKVDGWVAEIRSRLIQAKADLFAQNSNPTSSDSATVEQV